MTQLPAAITPEIITKSLLICAEKLAADHAEDAFTDSLRAKCSEICADDDSYNAFLNDPRNTPITFSVTLDIEADAMLMFLRQYQDESAAHDPFQIINQMLAAMHGRPVDAL